MAPHTGSSGGYEPTSIRAVELRVLHAAKACTERWGLDRLTIDDIAHASGVSRATIYRLFPGGKDVLFEALRVRELEEFFAELAARGRRRRRPSTTCSCARSSPPPSCCAPISTSP